MKLFLDNVGIIKKSQVLLDGLTVITGKNSSGKTTVGKTIYSLIAAAQAPVEAFEECTRTYIIGQLKEIEKVLQLRRMRRMHSPYTKDELGYDQIIRILTTYGFINLGTSELINFLRDTQLFIGELSLGQYIKYFSLEEGFSAHSRSLANAVIDGFEEWKQQALQICRNTFDMLESENAFYDFLQDRTAAYLEHEFNEQIQPVRDENAISNISLSDAGKILVKASVRDAGILEFSPASVFMYPYEKCIFIDNPFVIDHLDEFEEDRNSLFHSLTIESNSDRLISSEDIASHDDVLIRQIMQNEEKNFFNNLEIQKKYKEVFDRINDIVPGEFLQTTKGIYYANRGAKLSIKNLATGSKMFFIIKKLLLNGLLDEKTMLVLDEPESHLHPEWINKFAEILVVLIKDIGVNVLLTTHSPNLMLALNVYAKKHNIADNAHFYLAESKEDYYSRIRCIDESIGEGYSHLAMPLVQMNLYWEELDPEG